jgi:hypothetical protein
LTSAVNALFLFDAIMFLVVSYLTNFAAHVLPGEPGPDLPAFSLPPRLIYRLSIWLAPFTLAGMAGHVAATAALQLGRGASLVFLPVGLALFAGVGWLALQVWRQR